MYNLQLKSGLFETNSEVASVAVRHHGNYGPTPRFSSKQVEAVAAISGNGDNSTENIDDLLQK